jgi:2-polyprenyl-3-methyl-5-hydroxy-6-metoxy-1,4-benzoquinol methylase
MGVMNYPYLDLPHPDILRMIPADGVEIGSIGCAFGTTEAELVKSGRRVHGVDVEPSAIEVAKTRLTSARLITPDDREPFAPASLDGLILADVLEHMPLAWDRLRDFSRAVRPNGWVVISVPNMRNLKVFSKFYLRGDWPEDPRGTFDRTHIQVMSRRRLKRWCEQALLRPEEWFGTYLTVGYKQQLLKTVSALTLGLLHEWILLQLQVRCRKTDV